MKRKKQRTRGRFALAASLILCLLLLSGCGNGAGEGGQPDESGGADVVGLWESEEWGGICLELGEDGAGTIYTYDDTGELAYEWDGETLTLWSRDDDGEVEETAGELQEDGSIGIPGLGYFFRVEERSYGPDMAGTSWSESGGMESELEGEWVHSSAHLMLSFDGKASATFQDMREGGGSVSSGSYSYDGETVTVDLSSGVFEGHIDDGGDLIIEIDGEGGWYSRGDSSQLRYPDVTGPEAEMVGYWKNDATGDFVEFGRDGSVTYSIGGGIGFASPFTFDGETVTFSDYTGRVDREGDLIVDGLDGWFSRDDTSGGSSEQGSGSSGYALGGAYDNDDAEISIVFYSDGTVTISDFDTAQDGVHTVDGGYILMEMDGAIPYEGWYDAANDTFTVDGLSGHFYAVDDPWYTP